MQEEGGLLAGTCTRQAKSDTRDKRKEGKAFTCKFLFLLMLAF